MNAYKADVALLAGDLTGKAIVPIIQHDGRYEADIAGVHRTVRNDEELAKLERDIADIGYYSFVTSSSEAERLSTDESGRDELLHRLMNERVEAWLTLATERLGEGAPPMFLIPGNDDEFVIDSILEKPGFRSGQCGRQGARHTGRAAAAVLRLVQQHAVADPARGDRGRALHAA